MPYQETPFGMLPPEMVLQIFSFFLDDLPFLVRSIGLTCRHWNDLASSNPRAPSISESLSSALVSFMCCWALSAQTAYRLSWRGVRVRVWWYVCVAGVCTVWKRVMELGLSEVLSWTSADPISVVPDTNAPPDIDDSSYKDLFCKYHVRIRSAFPYPLPLCAMQHCVPFMLCTTTTITTPTTTDSFCNVHRMSDNWENGSYSIKALTGHKDFIRCVRFDKTHRAVSSGVDRMVCVWDLKTGECIKTMKGHTGGTLHSAKSHHLVK
jgi:hypothetical protein